MADSLGVLSSKKYGRIQRFFFAGIIASVSLADQEPTRSLLFLGIAFSLGALAALLHFFGWLS